jgi:hypothetical protein
MKVFIRKILFFLSIITLILLIVELFYRNIPNDYSYKDAYINRYKDSIEIVILGSSHSLRDLNPAAFDLWTFNFAMVSQTINYDQFILEKYANTLSRLRFIILPISYFTFSDKLEDGKEYWRKYRYIHYLKYNELSFKERLSIRSYFSVFVSSGRSIIADLINFYIKDISNI